MKSESLFSSRWQQWYDENCQKLLHYARTKTRCDHDAEDVLQDAMIRMWENRDRCPNGIPAMSFAYQIVRCRAIDVGRQIDRRAARENISCQDMVDGENWETSGVPHGVAQRETASILRAEVGKLPEKYREVIELRLWSELTFSEIGKRVGLSQNTVSARYRRALCLLRQGQTGVTEPDAKQVSGTHSSDAIDLAPHPPNQAI
ncbi:MAG: sigma-70 family RNA polymerase sigma factor [Verrucomicrobiae bacterium]|nr:sigma-70 family RNA polymerase sigma factor [Verrucomicrobiae bacterium]